MIHWVLWLAWLFCLLADARLFHRFKKDPVFRRRMAHIAVPLPLTDETHVTPRFLGQWMFCGMLSQSFLLLLAVWSQDSVLRKEAERAARPPLARDILRRLVLNAGPPTNLERGHGWLHTGQWVFSLMLLFLYSGRFQALPFAVTLAVGYAVERASRAWTSATTSKGQ